jgi:hypothetical protein
VLGGAHFAKLSGLELGRITGRSQITGSPGHAAA